MANRMLRAMRGERLWRGVALAAVLGLLFTQQFLTVHELRHLGDTDSTHCEYAPLAATAGGAVMSAAPVLAPPVAVPPHFPAPQAPIAAAPAPAPQARGPPLC